MNMMSLYDNLGNPTENFQILTLPCHSQMIVMAALVFFAKIPKWQWHYDHVLGSLYLMATSRIHLYTFFQLSFVKSVFSSIFDPEAPFDGVPLFMAHPAGAPLQPFPPASLEIDPSEVSASTSSSSFAPTGDRSSPGGLRVADIMVNGFPSFESG